VLGVGKRGVCKPARIHTYTVHISKLQERCRQEMVSKMGVCRRVSVQVISFLVSGFQFQVRGLDGHGPRGSPPGRATRSLA